MKRLFTIILLGMVSFVMLMQFALFAADTGITAKAQPSFKSTSPRYAKIVLTEDKTKVLSVVFDESKGIGTGYNLLYADLNFNGTFEANERFEANPLDMPFPYYIFPFINISIPYNEKGVGITTPCSIRFIYIHPSQNDIFHLEKTIKLRRDSSLWEYIFSAKIAPSDNPASTSLVDLIKTPELKITTRPDPEKKGNLGIGLSLLTGDTRINWKKDGVSLTPSINARIEIKTKDGKVVHQDTAGMDKFTFT